MKFSEDAVSLIEAMRLHRFDSAEIIILKPAFTRSIRVIWEVMIGLAGISLFASCFIKGYHLNQALGTEQGFVDGREVKHESGGE
jgi:hypothetical protein